MLLFFRQDLCQSPVHHEHFTEVTDHDVFRLEIPVNHTLVVGEGDGIADFLKQGEKSREGIFCNRLLDPRLRSFR